jgi:formylglycine-generating enzyme required for sulfatase activity
MSVNKTRNMITFFILHFILSWGPITGISDSQANEFDLKHLRQLYEKKETWQETMLTTRNNYVDWLQRRSVKQSDWYMNDSKESGYSDIVISNNLDLEKKAKTGKLIWSKISGPKIGSFFQLPTKGIESIFAYRIINVKSSMTIPVNIGSAELLDVFLNGERIAYRAQFDLPPNDARIKLDLKAGENHLVLKVINRKHKNSIKCYFTVQKSSAITLWEKVEQDYPLQACRMLYDLKEGENIEWFNNAGNVGLDKKMIKHVLLEIGHIGDSFSKEFKMLLEQKDGANHSSYLDFYVKVNMIRNILMDIEKVNFSAMGMAVNDLANNYPEQYINGTELLKQISIYEQELPDIYRNLAKGQPQNIKFVYEYLDKIQSLQRKALLSNPLLDFKELLLIKRKPLGNPYWFTEKGRGIGQLIGMPKQSSWQLQTMPNIYEWDNEIVTLSPLRPEGKLSTVYRSNNQTILTDMDIAFNGEKVLFSMPDDKRMWQLNEIDLNTQHVEQITGDFPDVHSLDGCYLPNGKIAYVSTAHFQGVPCNAGVNVGMMYLMDGDGKNIRQICFEQDHDFCPTVMNDGRILYLRWEYTDIPHIWGRYLFTMNPDGTGQREFYGSGSYWPNAIFYARPVPGHPSKVAGIVTGHHVGRVGELVVFDPAQSPNAADGAIQKIPGYGKKVEPIIMDKLTDDVWPKFLHPWPLSEKYFLVSCRPTRKDLWGIYLVDVFDNMVLVKELEGHVLLEPIPYRKTAAPPVIAETVNPKRKDALVYIENIYHGPGLQDVPVGTVKNLRLFTYHFAYRSVAGKNNRVGVDGPWEPKRILGTVPLEKDGSAMFRVPANTPISIQPLDAEGKALQLMRSWMTAMPGETISCVGCHEKQNSTPFPRRTIALAKEPEDIQPWYGPERGFGFVNEVQPVLDKYCVICHDGKDEDKPDLRRDQGKWLTYKNGDPDATIIEGVPREQLVTKYAGVFPPSYIELRSRIRVGGLESDIRLLNPCEFHADNTELFQMLNKGHYGVSLDKEAVERLSAWIDLNAPCHGTWQEVVGLERITNDHQRRRDLNLLYAGIDQDPEAMVKLPAKLAEPNLTKTISKTKYEPPHVAGWPFGPKEAKRRQGDINNSIRSFEIGNKINLDFVSVPEGQFIIGDPDGHPDEQPLSSVQIDKPFWMSKYEITNEQYAQYDPHHDSRWEHKGYPMFSEEDLGIDLNLPKQPVVRVSQQQAMAFCRWLSEKSGLTVTLPTEAQWEYACRAGTDGSFHFGTIGTDFSKYANLADLMIRDLVYDTWGPDLVPRDARFNDKSLVSANVGQFKPNAWGLYDMNGNVWEWTRSTYKPYPYNKDDGRNAVTNTGKKVVRGGSWYDRPKRSRSAFRLSYPAWQKVYNVGFRVVIIPDDEIKITSIPSE